MPACPGALCLCPAPLPPAAGCAGPCRSRAMHSPLSALPPKAALPLPTTISSSSSRQNHHIGDRHLCGGLEHVDETGLKHGFCTSGTQKRFYLHRNQNETSTRRLMRNFAATVRYYPYSIKLAAHGAPRTTLFFSINWRKHELHAESSRRAQGPLSRAA